jgi:MoaA/NifB/PqqE/SkfB family radical SAM enzyme
VISQKIKFRELLQGAHKFLLMKAGRGLFSVNLEVTRRCNVRCGFCDYWKEKGPERRLEDYAPIVRHLNPLHLTLTGGEPLLRPDLESIIGNIRQQTTFIYMNVITNGSLLTLDRARSLWDAGLNQLSVSLDFPDERHDRQRGKPGLWQHLQQLLPRLRASGMDNLCLNTIIMEDNLEDLVEIARVAKEWGFKVSYSTYNPFKNNNRRHTVSPGRQRLLQETLRDLVAWKRSHRNITNSDFYLENVARYFRQGSIQGCLAGRKWVQVSPDGTLRRCSEGESLGPWEEFRPHHTALTSCQQCWYACRGEAEAPLGLKRIAELNR